MPVVNASGMIKIPPQVAAMKCPGCGKPLGQIKIVAFWPRAPMRQSETEHWHEKCFNESPIHGEA